jgi:sortase A
MRQALRVTGELFLTAGVTSLLFVGYLVWGSGVRAADAQRQFSAELGQQWKDARPAASPARGAAIDAAIDMVPEQFDVATGQPFAFITIPAFGKNWRFTVIQGTALAQLNVSPGHVPGTQWPGQVGNFAVAGHRVTSGNPFWSLPSLQDGDLVDIATQLNDYTYRVTGKQLVSPADTTVLDPVPGQPDQQPSQRLITLITCDPAWTGTHRVIVTGVLVGAQPR